VNVNSRSMDVQFDSLPNPNRIFIRSSGQCTRLGRRKNSTDQDLGKRQEVVKIVGWGVSFL
jgi:hypothetical protein